MRNGLRAALSVILVAMVAPAALGAQESEADPAPAAEAAQQAVGAKAVLEAVDAAPEAVAALEARTDIAAEDVKVVAVDKHFTGEAATALDGAIEENSDALMSLRAAIAANEAISSAIAEEQATANQVIGLELPAAGSVIVYTRTGTGG